ncbi:hypothetical protein CYMTET_23309, partial [Cymbomonas tetramitiformis]
MIANPNLAAHKGWGEGGTTQVFLDTLSCKVFFLLPVYLAVYANSASLAVASISFIAITLAIDFLPISNTFLKVPVSRCTSLAPCAKVVAAKQGLKGQGIRRMGGARKGEGRGLNLTCLCVPGGEQSGVGVARRVQLSEGPGARVPVETVKHALRSAIRSYQHDKKSYTRSPSHAASHPSSMRTADEDAESVWSSGTAGRDAESGPGPLPVTATPAQVRTPPISQKASHDMLRTPQPDKALHGKPPLNRLLSCFSKPVVRDDARETPDTGKSSAPENPPAPLGGCCSVTKIDDDYGLEMDTKLHIIDGQDTKVILYRRGDLLFVTFRGTKTFTNILTNVDLRKVPYNGCPDLLRAWKKQRNIFWDMLPFVIQFVLAAVLYSITESEATITGTVCLVFLGLLVLPRAIIDVCCEVQCTPMLHAGFLAAYQRVDSELRRAVVEHMAEFPNMRAVVFAGHSLGGALATIGTPATAPGLSLVEGPLRGRVQSE